MAANRCVITTITDIDTLCQGDISTIIVFWLKVLQFVVLNVLAVNYFRKTGSIVDVRLGSKYASAINFYYKPFSLHVSQLNVTHLNVKAWNIWDALHDFVPFAQFKKRENSHEGVLLLKLQNKACNFTKNNSPPWVFFTFFKLHKRYQITQSITYSFLQTKIKTVWFCNTFSASLYSIVYYMMLWETNSEKYSQYCIFHNISCNFSLRSWINLLPVF